MEYQTTGWLSPKLKQLEAENARLREELVQANDYANRKADEKQELAEQLAAWKQTAEAHKENFDILAGDLRMKLAAAHRARKRATKEEGK